MNGGFKKWVSEGRAVEKTENVGQESDYDYQLRPELYTDFQTILQLEKDYQEGKDHPVILDARPDSMFATQSIIGSKSLFVKTL